MISKAQYVFISFIAGIGGIAGVVYLANKYSDWESIDEHLSLIGRPLLGIHEVEKWKKIETRYKHFENKDLIKGIEKTANLEEIQRWCSMNSIEDYKNSDLYVKVSTWCTEPLTISELIDREKKLRKLNTSKKEDKDNWNIKLETYKNLGNKRLISKQNTPIEAHVITDIELKSWCKDNSGKSYKYELDFLYLSFIEWCTVKLNNH